MKEEYMHSRSGFTLLEVLVALVILTIAAAGFLRAANQGLHQTDVLITKMIASWLAENRLVELRTMRGWPDTGSSDSTVSMAGREWHIHITIKETIHSDLRKIEVTAAPASDSSISASLIGFLGRY